MKFQSALVAVAVADIDPLKRLDTLVRSRLKYKMINQKSFSFINKSLDINIDSLTIIDNFLLFKFCAKSKD